MSALAVRVPASSANVGPGFDVFGLALSLHAEVRTGTEDAPTEPVGSGHPAMQAFRLAGGVGNLWVDSPIPSGRGLGFSGAVRVAGTSLGLAQKHQVPQSEMEMFLEERRFEIIKMAGELEGHFDNVAASVMGGFVTASRELAVSVPLDATILENLCVLVWVPFFQTSTAKSRTTLASTVERDDAVFNIARSTQLVVALVTGNLDVLGSSVADRLHQNRRLAEAPMCEAVMKCFDNHGAVASWLSGSGPTVAAFVERSKSAPLAAIIARDFPEGNLKTLAIDVEGLRPLYAA